VTYTYDNSNTLFSFGSISNFGQYAFIDATKPSTTNMRQTFTIKVPTTTSYTYYLGTSASVFDLNFGVTNSSCDEDMAFTYTATFNSGAALSNGISFDSDSGELTVQTSTSSDVNTYTIKIVGVLNTGIST
jgi:hypothetical protein